MANKNYTLLILIFIFSFNSFSQKKKNKQKLSTEKVTYNNLSWRNIGPFRGGRSVASCGLIQKENVFYMGSTGGGVWKSEDYGINWNNISDGFFKTGTVGAIAVSESDENVVVVGMGEHAARGVMTSMGDGVYISTDAGKSWDHIGLKNSYHISDVIIHPENPKIIFVSVQGSQYGPSKDRGVFKTVDGGNTWKKVLYVNQNVGASSISMDMTNPRVIYASMWEHSRTPWQISSGGKNSGIYKSSDGGETWIKLKNGFPKEFGKSGISVSRANPNLVYVILEAEGEKGGLYKSSDKGENWKLVNNERINIARSWYYMEVFADPQDENTVYVLNAPVMKSIDGGKSFKKVDTPHGDNHHLWINPMNNNIMINSNDGGANITTDAGRSWSTQKNQPTSQFYRVIADSQTPYHVYGGQQDNSAIGIKNRTYGGGISWKDWYSVAGCESAFLAFDDKDPKTVYGGCYQGIIERWNRETGVSKQIKEYPELSLGNVPKDFKYRFNWNAPILTSPQNSNIIYHAGNVVFKSSDKGNNWEIISGDLTRNEKNKHGEGGTPYTNEAAGGENYNTIMSLAISKKDGDVIWAGTDDGLIHLTRNGGKNWINITPKGLKPGIINSIDLSEFKEGKAYITVMRYKFMDMKPYVYKTEDYGKNWKLISYGIEGENNFVRVVRADKKIKGLLYAGTETGFFISKNDGVIWEKLQLNLPVVPINDLFIRNNDLIAATAGRSFWVLDNLSPLQELNVPEEPKIITESNVKRFIGGYIEKSVEKNLGQNPLPGIEIDYFIPKGFDTLDVKISILKNDIVIRRFENKKDTVKFKTWQGGPTEKKYLKPKYGFNRFNWDLRREPFEGVEKVFVYGGYNSGIVSPGNYKIKMNIGDKEYQNSFLLESDPNFNFKTSEYLEQEELLLSIEKNIRNLNMMVTKARNIKMQLENNIKKMDNKKELSDLIEMAKKITFKIDEWEQNLIQPKQKTFQDVINFHNKLNAEFIYLHEYVNSLDPQVTSGAMERFKDLDSKFRMSMKTFENDILVSIEKYNIEYERKNIPAIILQ